MKAGKNHRNGITWRVAVFVLCLGWMAQAHGETLTCKVCQYAVHLDSLRVDDAEAHVLALFSRKGVATLESGEVVEYASWGTADLIRGTGAVRGYTLLTHQDGSIALSVVEGITERGSVRLTGAFTRGTGRFEGIKGVITISGKSRMPFDEERETLDNVYYEVTATYTLPPR